MSNRKIYGFAGRKRSGKGVACDVIKNNSEQEVAILTIANYLKQLCCDILGININELNERKDNDYTFEIKPYDKWFNLIHNKTNIPKETIINEIGNITFTNIRQMLQVIGTDLIRKYNPDWHVQQLENDINSYPEDVIIAIDDVRFPNEVQTIKKLGGKVFFIIRPNFFEVSNHISETSLKWNSRFFKNGNIIINDLPLELYKEYLRIAFLEDFSWEQLHNNPLFVFSMSQLYNTINYNYPNSCTDKSLLPKIIEQNKNDARFLTKGILHFTAENRHEACDFNCDVLNNCYSNCNKRNFVVYNPFLNENLKLYL